MKRPHPLALAVGVAIFVLLVWLNTSPFRGELLYWQPGITKHHTFFGWPFSSFYREDDGFDWVVQLPVLLLDVLIALGMLLPAYTLNALLRRTLHVHLTSAIVLSLTAGVLLFWLVREAQDAWPRNPLGINTLIALAILSFVLLLSEHLLRRNSTPPSDE